MERVIRAGDRFRIKRDAVCGGVPFREGELLVVGRVEEGEEGLRVDFVRVGNGEKRPWQERRGQFDYFSSVFEIELGGE